MAMNPRGRAGRRERAQRRPHAPPRQTVAQAWPETVPPKDPWLPALMVLFIGLLLLALTVVLELRSPDRSCPQPTAACASARHMVSPPAQQDVNEAAHTLGTLHSLGFILAIPVCFYLSCATPWSANMLKPGPSKRCMRLAWLGALLVGMNSFVLAVNFAYMPLIDLVREERGGVMVPYRDLPKSRRDLKPGDALGAAYVSGRDDGSLLGFAVLGAAIGVNSLRTGRTRRR